MIELVRIDRNNYMDCICLRVREDQRSFVADNARSLAEAAFEEGIYTRAICADGRVVGFLLFDYDGEIPGWSLSRMMIGAQFQHRGYGRAAVERFMKMMREEMGARELFLSVSVENAAARAMYEKLGFRFVEQIEYEFDGATYREARMRVGL